MTKLSLSTWFALATLPLTAQTGDWQSLAASDPVLTAMRAEVDRSKTGLKLEQVGAPYYIEYSVFDVDQYTAEASYGSLRTNLRTRLRFLRVVVRLGDYKLDSYSGRGEGNVEYMPVDDDPFALRHQIWLATDQAYKAAAESLTAKEAQLKQLTIDQPVDDFARAEPVQSIGPLAALQFDPAPWTKVLEDACSSYLSDPLVEWFGAGVKFSAINRYFVNTEGTVVRSGQTLYELQAAAGTQAADGMSLRRQIEYLRTKIEDLPATADFLARAAKLPANLKELRDAPVVDEEYRGPVLFSAPAAASVFGDLVGDNVLGVKAALGKNARTTGAFSTNYKSRVLPEFLSVEDDPALASFKDRTLLGHYDIDDEGVPAQKVSVIEHGILVNYLVGREPIRDFPKSNGHGRARVPSSAPAPGLGNLVIRSSEPVSRDELKKKLIDLCRQRDLPYGYLVESFEAKNTPGILRKIRVKDGREELVRGAEIGDLDTRSLRTGLIAAGDDLSAQNHAMPTPHTIIAPSILFDELEIKRNPANKGKLPEYPAPSATN